MKESCGNCRFAFPVPQDLQSKICRRNPPQVLLLAVKQGAGGRLLPLQEFVFPLVDAQTWCGEWNARGEGFDAIEITQFGQVSKLTEGLGPGNSEAPNG